MRLLKTSTLVQLLHLIPVVLARPSIDLKIGGSLSVSVKAECQVTALMLFLGMHQTLPNITETSRGGCILLSDRGNENVEKLRNVDAVEPEMNRIPMNCQEVQALGSTESGIYSIAPYVSSPERRVDVFCDMTTDGGGWTVIQRRGDYETQEDFYRLWADYMKGFDDLSRDFWLGLEHIHALTNQSLYEARFDLGDFEGETRYAKYSTFAIGDEEQFFNLSISGYSGDAGDSIGSHNGMKFSTKDKDQDLVIDDCAELCSGGWWYINCCSSNLDGVYHRGGSHALYKNIMWYDWRGKFYSLKNADIKIRPKLA